MPEISKIKWKDFTGSHAGKRILLLSDLHLTICEESEPEQILQYCRERSETFHKKSLVDTRTHFLQLLESAREEQVDLIVFAGDVIDCPSATNLLFLREQLENLEIPYVFTTGNHDWNFGWDYKSDQSRQKYLPKLEQICGYSLEASLQNRCGIPFLVIDSSEDEVSEHACELLRTCRAQKEPFFVVMHVPFTTNRLRELSISTWGFDTTMGKEALPMNETTKRFYQELLEIDDCCILAGHVHEFDDEQLDGKIRQIVAPPGCQGKGLLIEL